MNIVMLDSATLGADMDFSLFKRLGSLTVYSSTAPEQVEERIADCEVVILNKVKLGAHNLLRAGQLRLICVTATGYDNVDIPWCAEHGIAVCNVRGYSSSSVAQVTAAMALSLANHLRQFDDYVKDGSYTASGVHNKLEPVFHELEGMVWGIVGLGDIGRRVAGIAAAFGCRVIATKRKKANNIECVELDELCGRSDIISIHLPLTDETRGIISREMISLMKPSAIVINMARGAVCDEEALAKALEQDRIGGLGIDVYSSEPMSADSPYMRLVNDPRAIFTPHMAWGAYESRVRCMEEIAKNIEAFFAGGTRNRVDIQGEG